MSLHAASMNESLGLNNLFPGKALPESVRPPVSIARISRIMESDSHANAHCTGWGKLSVMLCSPHAELYTRASSILP